MRLRTTIAEGRRIVLYLGNVADEIERESIRLDRPKTWVMRQVWLLAREQIRQLESSPQTEVTEDAR